jgi:hypothetical protein
MYDFSDDQLIEAFLLSRLDLARKGNALVEVAGCWMARGVFYRRMLACRVEVPEALCDPLMVARGSTYADAAEAILVRGGEVARPSLRLLMQ